MNFKERKPSRADAVSLVTWKLNMPIGSQDAPLPFNLTPLDRMVLSQTDEEYQAHTWEELKQIIGRLERLKFLFWQLMSI